MGKVFRLTHKRTGEVRTVFAPRLIDAYRAVGWWPGCHVRSEELSLKSPKGCVSDAATEWADSLGID